MKRLKILVIILVVLAILFVYMLYSPNKTSSPEKNVVTVTREGQVAGQNSSNSESREILDTLARLKTAKMDTDFLNEKAFESLVDHSVELIEEPVGRVNPFAPF